MARAVSRRRKAKARHRHLPFILTCIFVVLPTANSGMNFLHDFAPYFIVIATFYWALMGPTFLPKHLVILLGLIYDLLHGTVLGMHSLLLLLTWTIVHSQRDYIIQQGFVIIWAIFMLVLSVFMALVLSLSAAYTKTFPSIDAITWYQWALTVFLYPPIHLLYFYLQKYLTKI